MKKGEDRSDAMIAVHSSAEGLLEGLANTLARRLIMIIESPMVGKLVELSLLKLSALSLRYL